MSKYHSKISNPADKIKSLGEIDEYLNSLDNEREDIDNNFEPTMDILYSSEHRKPISDFDFSGYEDQLNLNNLKIITTEKTNESKLSSNILPVINSCDHFNEISIGGYNITATGVKYLYLKDDRLRDYDIIIPLVDDFGDILESGKMYVILPAYLKDYGGVPTNWEKFIIRVSNLMKNNKKIVTFCMGGHGRTGTFLASLLAIMEPDIKDPILEMRNRYCKKIIESKAQADAIFKLKNMELPKIYEEEFKPRLIVSTPGESKLYGNYTSYQTPLRQSNMDYGYYSANDNWKNYNSYRDKEPAPSSRLEIFKKLKDRF